MSIKLVEFVPRRLDQLKKEVIELEQLYDKEQKKFHQIAEPITKRINELYNLLLKANSKFKRGDTLKHKDKSLWIVIEVNPILHKEYEIQRVKKNGGYGQKKMICETWMYSKVGSLALPKPTAWYSE